MILERSGRLFFGPDQYPDTAESGEAYEEEMGVIDLLLSLSDKEDYERIIHGIIGRIREA